MLNQDFNPNNFIKTSSDGSKLICYSPEPEREVCCSMAFTKEYIIRASGDGSFDEYVKRLVKEKQITAKFGLVILASAKFCS